MSYLSHDFEPDPTVLFLRHPVPYARKLEAERKARHARFRELAQPQRALAAPVAVVEAEIVVELAPAPALATDSPLARQFEKAGAAERAREAELKIIHVRQIQKAVAKKYGVTLDDILSQSKKTVVVKPRQIAMYLTKTLTLKSLPEIGRKFGGRDHTTILHGVRKIGAIAASSPKLAAELQEFVADLTGGVA